MTVARTAYAISGFLHKGICVFTRKLRAKLLVVGAALAAVGALMPLSASAATATQTATATAAAASPATVAVGSGWFGMETPGGDCLDGNSAGSVYLNPCQVPGNKYQDWNWTKWQAYSPYSGYYYFYSIHSQATGRCLDSNAAGDVYTNPCQAPGNAYQDWYWGPGNTSGYSKFTDVATSLSLWGVDTENPVRTSNNNQPQYNNWGLSQ